MGAKPAPEPNNLNDAENCAGGNFTQSFGSPRVAGWADNICEENRIYICKLQGTCHLAWVGLPWWLSLVGCWLMVAGTVHRPSWVAGTAVFDQLMRCKSSSGAREVC